MKATIEITNTQLHNLIKAVYLSDWVINAHRMTDEIDSDSRSFEQYVLGILYNAGCKDHIDFDAQLNTYFVNGNLEESFQEIIDDYEDETFWDELASRLAERDYYEKNKPKNSETDNDRAKRVAAIFSIEDKYNEEFERYGIERLKIRNNP
jgi:hypothetical protein